MDISEQGLKNFNVINSDDYSSDSSGNSSSGDELNKIFLMQKLSRNSLLNKDITDKLEKLYDDKHMQQDEKMFEE